MARIETRLAKSLYFCNVKSYMRHVVAAEGSVFRATNLLVKIHPDECGSSNAHKGLACNTLTARIGILYCSKVMANNAKELQDAQLKTVEGIQEFLESFHSVSELYERAANALSEIMLVEMHMGNEARKKVNDMVQDYMCILNLLDPLNEKGE